MEGCEGPFEDLVRQSILEREMCASHLSHSASASASRPGHVQDRLAFVYLEIGVASGDTFARVTDLLKEACPPWMQWVSIGIDLAVPPPAPGEAGEADVAPIYAIDVNGVKERLPDLFMADPGAGIQLKRPNLALRPNGSRDFMPDFGNKLGTIDLAFIDGCHGKNCVRGDFELVEPFIEPGGHVIFHDAGYRDQGTDWQPHCQERINVRAALAELKLIAAGPAYQPRLGWECVTEWIGDKKRGGNSCVVVRKQPRKG